MIPSFVWFEENICHDGECERNRSEDINAGILNHSWEICEWKKNDKQVPRNSIKNSTLQKMAEFEPGYWANQNIFVNNQSWFGHSLVFLCLGSKQQLVLNAANVNSVELSALPLIGLPQDVRWLSGPNGKKIQNNCSRYLNPKFHSVSFNSLWNKSSNFELYT